MQKTNISFAVLAIFAAPAVCLAADLEALKVDFLQGNYRRVIFEGQAQVDRINISSTDELSYILGLSYIKEGRLDLAQSSLNRVLNNRDSKFNSRASLALADTFLLGGRFEEAEEIYNKLISDNPNSKDKASVLYRLSQLELKRGNSQKGNEYLSKLKRDFPFSTELRLSRGIDVVGRLPGNSASQTGVYSVQLGFFSNQSNACNLRDKLLAKGFPAYIENSAGGYRVRAGKFKTEKEALDLENKLAMEGFQTKVCQ